jgi:hypothetical protein
MWFDQYLPLFTAGMTFVGLLFVAMQIRDATKQREMDSLVKVYDINRELLSLGFSHPQLFAIMENTGKTDPMWENRYLQLWFNQFSLVHSYLRHSLFRREFKESLDRDITDFMRLENVRRHWERNSQYYPSAFQNYANALIKKIEPPTKAAQLKSGG